MVRRPEALSRMTLGADWSRPRRAAPLVALVLLLAGCTTGTPAATDTPGGPPPNDSPPPPTDTTTSPLTPKPLPEGPDSLTRTNVLEFVEAFEVAYQWNRELNGDALDMSVAPRRARVLEATADGFVVHLEVGFSKTVRDEGSRMVADGFYTVNYLVNGTTMRRAQVGGQRRPGPDPRNGTVVVNGTVVGR